MWRISRDNREKMEINTKEPEAILCCSLTPDHFTLKACIHKGFTDPLNTPHHMLKTQHNLTIMGS